jgi:hypothetical protein
MRPGSDRKGRGAKGVSPPETSGRPSAGVLGAQGRGTLFACLPDTTGHAVLAPALIRPDAGELYHLAHFSVPLGTSRGAF